MKQLVIALLLSLSMPIALHSQNIYPIINTDSLVTITSEQLKITNLIFNEHEYLTEKVDLLNNQINNLEELNKLYVVQDSIQRIKIDKYKNAYEDSYKKYIRLNKRYKVSNAISLGSLLILLGVLICR